eukprot:TRINITY_DN66462_c7_g2_i2.p1 TRINITY_DN66462_c7_g2~~TRINITY_DN66462_c7_g2_i2.p1  ORF type:complete len:790 (+),score=421.03 TRINITY_DN66462_c7_g2_i2:26-2395(+)
MASRRFAHHQRGRRPDFVSHWRIGAYVCLALVVLSTLYVNLSSTRVKTYSHGHAGTLVDLGHDHDIHTPMYRHRPHGAVHLVGDGSTAATSDDDDDDDDDGEEEEEEGEEQEQEHEQEEQEGLQDDDSGSSDSSSKIDEDEQEPEIDLKKQAIEEKKQRIEERLGHAMKTKDLDALSNAIQDAEELLTAAGGGGLSGGMKFLDEARQLHQRMFSEAEAEFAHKRSSDEKDGEDETKEDAKSNEGAGKPRHSLAEALKRFPPDQFPIGVVAHKRAALLRRSLESLTSLKGLRKFDPEHAEETTQITVYQDGDHEAVKRVVDQFPNVRLKQNVYKPRASDGAISIAKHYKFTLSNLFNSNPLAEYAIVVEEDMVFSPDFLQYFSQTAHLYEDDPTVYCITTWNDNGFKGLAVDNKALYRTEFFVGLGWLVSRKIYQSELERVWPNTHWDHWMREPQRRKGRECVYPEVSRNYNIGVRSTHSDQSLYDRYFAKIVLNEEADVDLGDTSRLVEHRYEKELVARIDKAIELDEVGDIGKHAGKDVRLFYKANGPSDAIWEATIAPFFGFWHSVPHIRGIHRGLSQFKWDGAHVFLIASYSPYVRFKKNASPMLQRHSFGHKLRELPKNYRLVKGAPQQSCTQVCAAHDPPLRCVNRGFSFINNCEALESVFSCAECHASVGTDQPAYVFDKSQHNFGHCLFTTGAVSCDGHHPVTARACPCATLKNTKEKEAEQQEQTKKTPKTKKKKMKKKKKKKRVGKKGKTTKKQQTGRRRSKKKKRRRKKKKNKNKTTKN